MAKSADSQPTYRLAPGERSEPKLHPTAKIPPPNIHLVYVLRMGKTLRCAETSETILFFVFCRADGPLSRDLCRLLDGRGGPRVQPGAKARVPAGLRGARASLSLQSREVWRVTTGRGQVPCTPTRLARISPKRY